MATSVALKFTFSTGKIVTKTMALDVAAGELETYFTEVYGEGEWVDVEIIHSENARIEVCEFVLGASTADLKFMEASANA